MSEGREGGRGPALAGGRHVTGATENSGRTFRFYPSTAEGSEHRKSFYEKQGEPGCSWGRARGGIRTGAGRAVPSEPGSRAVLPRTPGWQL